MVWFVEVQEKAYGYDRANQNSSSDEVELFRLQMCLWTLLAMNKMWYATLLWTLNQQPKSF